jgi:hypothetical protein
MFEKYHRAIVDAQFDELLTRVKSDGWTDVSVDRDLSQVYVTLTAKSPVLYTYRSRIDMSRYPVDPYWVGFINPDLPRERWSTASASDPRFWPWSPMPGLDGSFILAFQGPFRTFWCRECNLPFFLYHGDWIWKPAEWHLSRVVAYLREAVNQGKAPNRWRPLQRDALFNLAARAGITLPPGASEGSK